ncbi:MAG: PAS domain S-box protein [Phycisphaeraceae bacterium]
MLPLGVAWAVAYVAAVLAAVWSAERRLVWGIAGLCSILTLLAAPLSPEGILSVNVVSNRLLTLLVIWATAWAGNRMRRLQGNVQQREKRLKAVLDTAVDGIVTIDQRGRILSYNQAAERIFGYSAAQSIGQNVSLLMPEPDRSAHDGYLSDYSRTGEAKILGIGREVLGRRKDGSIFPMELALSEFQLDHERYFTGLVRDITERKQMEQALLESEAQFRSIFEQAGVGIARLDPDTRVILANQRLCDMLGYRSEELLGRRLREFAHPDDCDKEVPYIRQMLSGEVTQFTLENRYLRQDGTVLWLALTASAVHTSSSREPDAIRIVEDITNRKVAEQQLETTHHDLTERTATAEHQARQLRQMAQDLAHVEQRERSRLSSVLHDHLQQLLVAGQMQLQLLEGSGLEPKQRELVASIRKLLSESVAETRSLASELFPPGLRAHSWAETLEWLSNWVQEKHGLRVTVEADRVTERAEEQIRVLLFQCVRELLFNIVKHGGVSEAWVTSEHDGDALRVTVEDRGRGFDLEQTEFAATSPTGLGLGSVQERVELIGGRMHVRSKPNEGTRITLLVPLTPFAEISVNALNT